jgi:hypothetical protein
VLVTVLRGEPCIVHTCRKRAQEADALFCRLHWGEMVHDLQLTVGIEEGAVDEATFNKAAQRAFHLVQSRHYSHTSPLLGEP